MIGVFQTWSLLGQNVFFLYQLLFLKATTVFHTCVLCEKFDYVLGTRFETVPILELLS